MPHPSRFLKDGIPQTSIRFKTAHYPLSPTVEGKSKFILVRTGFGDMLIGGNRRDIESFFHVFPVDDLTAFAGDNDHFFDLATASNRREVRFNAVSIENRLLRAIAVSKIFPDN
jgi:hypothetical protein